MRRASHLYFFHHVLVIPSREGNEECIKILLQYNARIETEDHNNDTPLHLASYFGYVKCVELLLQANANIESKDLDQQTSLASAAEQGNIECITALLRYNANIETTDIDNYIGRGHPAPFFI